MTTVVDKAAVSADSQDASHAKRWWILAVLGVAQLMVVLDATIVNIALPTAQTSLNFDNADRQWIVTAYALAFGSLLLIGGRLADVFGRKWALLVGLTGFAIASAVGGAAVNFAMLVTARAVQGVFAALLAPAVLALLTTTFTEAKERGKAFGIFGAIAGAGASLGLLLGGLLTEYANWRWTLFVNLFFAVIAFIGATILLPTHKRSADRQPSDLYGSATVTLGLFGLVYGFSNAEQHGWSNAVTIVCLIAAAVLLVAFVLIEQRTEAPILPMRVVADRNRGGALLVMFLAGIGMFAVFLFLTYYLQQNLQYSPIKSGLAFLPLTGSLIVVASVGSTLLIQRVSARVLIPAGMFIAAFGMFLLTHIDSSGNYVTVVLPATLVLGIGLGLVFAPGFNLAVLGVEPHDAGVASAAVNAVQQVGGSVGTSLFNTIAGTVLSGYIASHVVPTGLSAGQAKLAALQVQGNAAVHSYTVAFWIAAAVFLAGAIASAALLRSGLAQPDGDAATVAV
jgi:EmrB/QacA subfamily drug resistance transporter